MNGISSMLQCYKNVANGYTFLPNGSTPIIRGTVASEYIRSILSKEQTAHTRPSA